MFGDKMRFFKPEDFSYICRDFDIPDVIAETANDILKKKGDVLYSEDLGPWHNRKIEEDTHQALLINIETIPKKECDHSVASYRHANGVWTIGAAICGKCGINLKPPEKWEPA